jgi:hypothetical protein
MQASIGRRDLGVCEWAEVSVLSCLGCSDPVFAREYVGMQDDGTSSILESIRDRIRRSRCLRWITSMSVFCSDNTSAMCRRSITSNASRRGTNTYGPEVRELPCLAYPPSSSAWYFSPAGLRISLRSGHESKETNADHSTKTRGIEWMDVICIWNEIWHLDGQSDSGQVCFDRYSIARSSKDPKSMQQQC